MLERIFDRFQGKWELIFAALIFLTFWAIGSEVFRREAQALPSPMAKIEVSR